MCDKGKKKNPLVNCTAKGLWAGNCKGKIGTVGKKHFPCSSGLRRAAAGPGRAAGGPGSAAGPGPRRGKRPETGGARLGCARVPDLGLGIVSRGQRSYEGRVPTSLIIFPPRCMVLLLTMSTMATPKLHRIPKEMQNPSPLMMAMMYLRGSPKQVQSQSGAFFSGTSMGFPSSVSSMVSPGFCLFSRTLPDTRRESQAPAPALPPCLNARLPRAAGGLSSPLPPPLWLALVRFECLLLVFRSPSAVLQL